MHGPSIVIAGCGERRRSSGPGGLALLLLLGWLSWAPMLRAEPRALVLQSDFGLKDGAVAAMKGVAFGVAPRLPIFDLTHEIAPYDIAEAAYRLRQTAPYWPAGTVFVSVVDPGVGTDRASVVLLTRSGHVFVSPDNGTLTLVADELGIEAVRTIDERVNRRAGSGASYTFHGRDVYAYTGARLAAGLIDFEEVGPLREAAVVRLPFPPARVEAGRVVGGIPVLDPNYGNVWTNIPQALLRQQGWVPGVRLRLTIRQESREVFAGEARYVTTFGDVPEGEPLVYLNSLLNVAVALNQANFAREHGIAAGPEWTLTLEKAEE